MAAWNGHLAMAELLIERGAHLDGKVKHYQHQTVLGCAVRKGQLQIARLLLEKGADPFLANSDGEDPLSFALALNQKEIAELLRSQVPDYKSKVC